MHSSSITRLQNFLTTHGDDHTKRGIIRVPSILHQPNLLTGFDDVDELLIQDEEESLCSLPENFYEVFAKMSNLSIRWSTIKSIGQPSIGHNLRILSLTNNHINCLDGIEVLTNLRTLDVSNNKLESLPPGIAVLKHLFHLSSNGNMLKCLPESIGQLKSLREVLLSSNQLSVLPSTICELFNLELLDVSRNKLMFLPRGIGNLTALEQLTLSENQLTELPNSLCECQALRYLHLSRNHLTIIPESFSSISLVSLTAANNRIVDIQPQMPHLRSLILDHNGLQFIPNVLTDCVKLEILSINNNRLDGFEPLTKLTSLRVLSLSSNEITTIPHDICIMTELRHLILECNEIHTLPNVIHKISNLSLLNLDKNDLNNNWKIAYSQGLNSLKEFTRQKSLQSRKKNNLNLNLDKTEESRNTRSFSIKFTEANLSTTDDASDSYFQMFNKLKLPIGSLFGENNNYIVQPAPEIKANNHRALQHDLSGIPEAYDNNFANFD